MSQSDYLKYKKVGTILKVDNTATGNMLPPILDQSDYLSFQMKKLYQ